MTKKKFYGVLDLIENSNGKIKDEIEKQLKTVLNYDPDTPCYDPISAKKTYQQRKQRALELGKSFYEIYAKPYRKKKNENINDIETTHDTV